MLYGHGGNIRETARQVGCDPSEIVDMSSNVNPFGPPPGLIERLHFGLGEIGRLPEVDAAASIEAMAGFLEIDAQRLASGNGTTQFIYLLPGILDTRHALIVGPTYADYASACRMSNVRTRLLFSREEDGFQLDPNRLEGALAEVDTVFVCNPNNPTGVLLPPEQIRRLCRRYPGVRFVVDESYFPFVTEKTTRSLVGSSADNLLVLISDSKIYRLPGLRIGFLYASKATTRRVREATPPWSVNALAQEAVRFLCENDGETRRFVRSSARKMKEQQNAFSRALRRVPSLAIYPSQTSFLLLGLPAAFRAPEVCRRMAQRRFLLRDCSNFDGLSDRFVRVSLQTGEVNRKAADALVEVLSPEKR